jgi:hypothetical protein
LCKIGQISDGTSPPRNSDVQAGAVSLGELGAFSAPQDAVLMFLLTYHYTFAMFRSAKSNALSFKSDAFYYGKHGTRVPSIPDAS